MHKNPIECFAFLQQKLRSEGKRYIKNYSNFIVEPIEGWLCKISGPPNRVRLICESKKINFEKEPWKFKQLKQLPKTYQTVSRMFHWLRVKEAIKKYKLSNISVPDMYLMKLNYQQGCEDTNTVVWQKKVKKATLFGKLGKKRQESILLTKQNDRTMLEQLLIVGKYAGLWDSIKNNILIPDSDTRSTELGTRLILIDFEQPNTTVPAQRFNAMTPVEKQQKRLFPERWRNNVASFVASLYKISRNKKYRAYIDRWVDKQPELWLRNKQGGKRVYYAFEDCYRKNRSSEFLKRSGSWKAKTIKK